MQWNVDDGGVEQEAHQQDQTGTQSTHGLLNLVIFISNFYFILFFDRM